MILVNCTGCITCHNISGTVTLFSKGTYSGTSGGPGGHEAGGGETGHLSGVSPHQLGQGGQQQPLEGTADGRAHGPPDPIQKPARTRSIRILIY